MIDFNRLVAKATVETFDKLDEYMKCEDYGIKVDKIIAESKGEKCQAQLESDMQKQFIETFAVTLLKNYHEALTLIMAAQGIDLNIL